MRFTPLFSTLLATLAITTTAAPVADPNVVGEPIEFEISPDLVSRGKDDTDVFNAVQKVHSDLKVGSYHVLELQYNNKPEDDNETDEELKKLREKLGFKHVGIVVGTVKEIQKEDKKKKKPQKLTFDGQFYDLVKLKQKKKNGMDVEQRNSAFRKPDESKMKLVYVKGTTKNKAGKIKNLAKDYFEDAAHHLYNVDNNNCNTFVKAIEKEL
ncbi:hypothetical protein GQ43DRAFT_434137 [Delitschia confertaspora ATCC 74209]|uniref:Uncharacterized protein n=1 Tax=Delitschia confertaspora ATCC 74209 TaxID=1513339 RepID=A0A9P4JG36_9PLEO|nr:hypothetical protein GQ43DRAFT_434137 [Delitschia confertaspora ATCC 74209]